jgi:preprotein translocase subunit SecY
MRQVETFLLQRHYDGFLKKGRVRARSGGAQAISSDALSNEAIMKIVVPLTIIFLVGIAAWAVRRFAL